MKGSNISTETGKISLNAGKNISIENETEHHEQIVEIHEKTSGFLSSKTKDIYDASSIDKVVGSNISGGSTDMNSANDTTVKASTVVADGDVHIQTGGNFVSESAEETSESTYVKQVKKSGLLSGGGLGFTIGKEKKKDQYTNKNTEQVGSTIGSVNGNVSINSNKDATIKASDVIAGKDIQIKGENVDITAKDNTYDHWEKHEYQRSGITVSLGGAVVETAQSIIQPLERASQVEDNRLKALYGYEAGKKIKDGIKKAETINDNLKFADTIAKDAKSTAEDIKDAKDFKQGVKDNLVNVHIGIGSEKSKAESQSNTIEAHGSSVKAQGDVAITSSKEDINIQGSSIEGENIKLNAAKDLNITASISTNKTKADQSSSKGSIGVSVGVSGVLGVDAEYNRNKTNTKENGTTYNESTVTAKKELTFESGKDVNIQGGALKGEKVVGEVGTDLNIASKQDSNGYESKSSSIGFSVKYDPGTAKADIKGSASKGNIDSKYNSVTTQSGIYAGKEGFDITVAKNTDLKGSVIDSDATEEKNKLTTGTLTWEDIQNKAEYKAGNKGFNVDTSDSAPIKDAGVTPAIGIGAEGKAESTTKSGVAKGNITIKDQANQKQDILKLNRETKNNLNKLGEIFDKTKIEERQELAELFGKLAFNRIHELKATKEQKAAYHALVASIMAKLTGGDALSSAGSAAINKMVSEEIYKISGKDPALTQWLSAALGYAITGEAYGASINASASKNNFLHVFFKDFIKSINPHSLKFNEVYAIYLDATVRPPFGAMIGCYVMRDEDHPDDLLIFDTIGGKAQLSFGLLRAGMSISRLTFEEGVNVREVLSGASVPKNLSLHNFMISEGIPLKEFIANLPNPMFTNEKAYSEVGLSSDAYAVGVGISYTWEVGYASDSKTWPLSESYYLEGIDSYSREHPDEVFTIYYDKKYRNTKAIKKIEREDGSYEFFILVRQTNGEMGWKSIPSKVVPSEEDSVVVKVNGNGE